jgi:hypothetical protein
LGKKRNGVSCGSVAEADHLEPKTVAFRPFNPAVLVELDRYVPSLQVLDYVGVNFRNYAVEISSDAAATNHHVAPRLHWLAKIDVWAELKGAVAELVGI